jgi:N-acetyl-gamma-glutamyl-phosphate reductase
VTVRAAILGASGYAGGELLRLLLAHPEAEPVSVVSRTNAGKEVGSVQPHLTRLTDLVYAA